MKQNKVNIRFLALRMNQYFIYIRQSALNCFRSKNPILTIPSSWKRVLPQSSKNTSCFNPIPLTSRLSLSKQMNARRMNEMNKLMCTVFRGQCSFLRGKHKNKNTISELICPLCKVRGNRGYGSGASRNYTSQLSDLNPIFYTLGY